MWVFMLMCLFGMAGSAAIINFAESFAGVDKAFAIQAGRELRIMVNNETIDDNKSKILAKDIAKKIENELRYPGRIKVTIIRETRIVEYAK